MRGVSHWNTEPSKFFQLAALSISLCLVATQCTLAIAECHSVDPHGCDSTPATAADLAKYPWLSDKALPDELKAHSPDMSDVISLEQKDLAKNGLGPRVDFRHGSLKSHGSEGNGYIEWKLELTRNGMAYRLKDGNRKELLVIGREHWELFAGDEKTGLQSLAAGSIAAPQEHHNNLGSQN